MSFTELGFEDRSTRSGYSRRKGADHYGRADNRMAWVIQINELADGEPITMELNGKGHFARKHLLLPSTSKDLDDMDGTALNEYVERKAQNRQDHRSRARTGAPQATNRWGAKYGGRAYTSTVLNLVPGSQNSISPRIAAAALATALAADGPTRTSQSGMVTVDFGQQCVMTTNSAGRTTFGSSMRVKAICRGDNNWEIDHYDGA